MKGGNRAGGGMGHVKSERAGDKGKTPGPALAYYLRVTHGFTYNSEPLAFLDTAPRCAAVITSPLYVPTLVSMTPNSNLKWR